MSIDFVFYYKMKKMLLYVRIVDKVIVIINILLYRIEGCMLLYRIYSFFILLIMGIEDILDKGYIKMVDLLDFIVVDSNIDVYVEMI